MQLIFNYNMLFTTVRGLRNLIKEAKVQGISEIQAKKVMLKYPIGMKKIGLSSEQIKSLSPLGIGTRGVAFALGDKVLKITNDKAEAEASSVLKNANNPSLTQYYKIWEFGNTGIYGIIQEKLNPLPENEGQIFNRALVKTRLPIWIAKSNYNFDKAKVMAQKYLKDTLKKKLEKGDISKEQIPNWMEDVNTAWNLMSSTYNMRNLVKTLGEFGIKFHDYHAGNIMQRDDGSLVLIDIGMSKIQGNTNVETIEEVMRLANSFAFLESL